MAVSYGMPQHNALLVLEQYQTWKAHLYCPVFAGAWIWRLQELLAIVTSFTKRSNLKELPQKLRSRSSQPFKCFSSDVGRRFYCLKRWNGKGVSREGTFACACLGKADRITCCVPLRVITYWQTLEVYVWLNAQACPCECHSYGNPMGNGMGWDGTAHICISHETQK